MHLGINMRKYVYHLTDKCNIDNIKENGLLPKPKGRYGYMSPECSHDPENKIFLLPILNGIGMKGFIDEWWHGYKKDIVILRMLFNSVTDPKQSIDKYYNKQEIWTNNKINPEYIFINEDGLKRPYNWVKIIDY